MIELFFNLGNLFVLPFWTLMIVLPNWTFSRKILDSWIPFGVLSSFYIYLFVASLSPENIAALSSPQLVDIAHAFANETVMATGWTHYLVMDLFVGRWIYWEGQKTGVWTLHSLLLCLFAGPIGLLSHLLTVLIRDRFFVTSQTDSTSASPPA